MSHNPNFSDDELEYIEPENLDTQRAFRQPTNATNATNTNTTDTTAKKEKYQHHQQPPQTPPMLLTLPPTSPIPTYSIS